MPIMTDGSVLPSFLSMSNTTQMGTNPVDYFNNYMVRAGEVTGIYYPDDQGNVSKKYIEYQVDIHHRDGQGVVTIVPYRCALSEMFGGAADHYRFALRPRTYIDPNQSMGDGARVLVACPNGDSGQAVIIASLKNPGSPSADDHGRTEGIAGQSGGVWMDRHFNGTIESVDNDGRLTLEAQGATDQKGQIKDPQGGQAPNLTLDPTDQSATLQAEQTAQIAANTIYVGSRDAAENLVLGQKLVEALGALIDVFQSNAGNMSISVLGSPNPIWPTFLADLIKWKVQYLQSSSPAPILAESKFTER